MDWKQITTIAVAVLTTLNMILTASGHAVLPISEDQVTLVLSCVGQIVGVALAVWKNCNFTKAAKEGTRAVVEKNSYPVLPIFKLLAEKGNIDEQMMYNTYNMGLGMILAVDAADVDKTMEAIKAAGDTPYVVGRIEDGEKGVTLC